uniref:Metalloendopeptidase n=1 Tax=Steinernema glaseri TaxID=37863 RepID=A0A1I7Z9P0_9BILA
MLFLVPIFLAVVATSTTITKRAAINRDNVPDRLWPTDRPIPYRFTSDFDDVRVDVRAVLEDIASKTCLSFEDVSGESSAESTKYTVVFRIGSDCGSETKGRTSTPVISLPEGTCRNTGTYYETMLYTLGMYEMQLRPDRDEYITVIWNNTDPDEVEQFSKTADFLSSTYNVPYDFDSLLQYTPGAR